jgi:hypothetical protein
MVRRPSRRSAMFGTVSGYGVTVAKQRIDELHRDAGQVAPR